MGASPPTAEPAADTYAAAGRSAVTSRPLSLRVALLGWLVVAAALTLATHLPALGRPFDHPHAWVSAHFATMARSFARDGVVALGGVPIQNNPPLGTRPDAYLHWPPLFPMVLAAAFRIFGESEAVALNLMLLILAATCLVLCALVARLAGGVGGAAAALAFLALPVTVLYGRLVAHLHLAILGMLVALFAFVEATREGSPGRRRWALAGAAALVVAVWSSWEPVLMCPGLIGAALWRRRRAEIRLAIWYCVVAVLAAAGVAVLYTAAAPEHVGELWHTLRYRTGLAPYAPESVDPHTVFHLDDYARRPPRTAALWLLAARLELLGQVPALALGAALVWTWTRRWHREPALLLLAGLASPCVLWFSIMFNHMAQHEYEIALAAPLFAAAVGLAVGTLQRALVSLPPRRALEIVLGLVLPAVLVLPMIPAARRAGPQPPTHELVAYAREIAGATPPGSIVLGPSASMVPVYYSGRHVIRGVTSDRLVERMDAALDQVFPGASVYLALEPAESPAFVRSLARYPTIRESPHLVLLSLRGSR